jgi:hypothetical protein
VSVGLLLLLLLARLLGTAVAEVLLVLLMLVMLAVALALVVGAAAAAARAQQVLKELAGGPFLLGGGRGKCRSRPGCGCRCSRRRRVAVEVVDGAREAKGAREQRLALWAQGLLREGKLVRKYDAEAVALRVGVSAIRVVAPIVERRVGPRV